MTRRSFLLWLLVLPAATAWAVQPEDDGIAVTVRRQGEVITVHTSAYVPVPPQQVWAVLTDFDHMTEIIEDLEMSRIVGHAGNKVIVQQKGKAARGPLSFSFESVREIELKPYEEMRGHLISGTMKKSDGVTRLIPEGEGTRIDSRGEFIPDIWVPPIIGVKIIEHETRGQFEEIRKEILRRSKRSALSAH